MSALRPARPEEAEEILALYRAAAEAGRHGGRSDWNDDYPTMDNIQSDLAEGGLYVLREGGALVAAISLVDPWTLDGLGVHWTPARAREICRFCLAPAWQGRGRAEEILAQAFDILRAQGYEAVRYLCSKENPAAYRLYTRLGHRQLEDTFWADTSFYSFETPL